jgi:hypothetical protein
MRKIYYPFTPTKTNRFRGKIPTFLVIQSNYDDFIIAHWIDDNENITIIEPDILAAKIYNLPKNTWVITYWIESFATIYPQLIDRFSKISGVGKDNRVLTLERPGLDSKKEKITVIDAFTFFAKSLPNMFKIVLGRGWPEDDIQKQAEGLRDIWSSFTDLLGVEFSVYPSSTPGATAIKIYKRFLPVKINARGLRTNRLLRQAVKPPALHWQPGEYQNAYLYDINAAFVHVMRTFKFPVELRGFCNIPPPTNKWIATVELDYKCQGKFSPLSVYLPEEGISVNPTEVRNHKTTITYIDALTLAMVGELKINKWYEGVYWTEAQELNLFRTWAEKIEEVSKFSPANKTMLKIVSRSLHSKFNQHRIYRVYEIVRTDYKGLKKFIKKGQARDTQVNDKGEFIVTVQYNRVASFKAFDRPDYEALILAGSRLLMYSALDDNTIYCHTDSIISTQPRDDLFIDNTTFGAWKLADMGLCYIAGLGIYTIGNKASTSGFNVRLWDAIDVIKQAARGRVASVPSPHKPGIFKQDMIQGNITISSHAYPRASVKGNTAYVTQSPTRKTKTRITRRLISSPLDKSLVGGKISLEVISND